MGSSSDNRKFIEIVEVVKSWMPRRLEPSKMSRDFWMPDASCRVCYECDSPFNIINRKHHCRLCGRVFCARCTTNSVLSSSSDEFAAGRVGDGDRIRVCNFCLTQRKQQSVAGNNDMMVESSPGLSLSPSSSSLVSTQSSCCTCNSAGSGGYSAGVFPQGHCWPAEADSVQMDSSLGNKDRARGLGKAGYLDARDSFSEPFGSCSRSDDEDDDYSICRSHSEAASTSPFNASYETNDYYQVAHIYERGEAHPTEGSEHGACDAIPLLEHYEKQGPDRGEVSGKDEDLHSDHAQPDPAPLNGINVVDFESVEYEKDGFIWLPPEPEDEEDEREDVASEEDDGNENSAGEWGYLRSSSFLDGEYRRSHDEHKRAMKRIVDGHFRSLISQLLQAENVPANEHESWLEIIMALSSEAATFIKPDTSRGGGMDPGGYVKVKCVACGHRNESTVIKGVVCKKNVAHRRMTSKIDKARILLLGGALEYQRVANHLSSFDTLLQQEMDHLKMAVAKIDAHHPNVLMVEKSVSRYAQDYLLARNISLVLNIKRPLLERIARCTGAQIIPSVDNLSAPKLGYCDSFHVDKFLEVHGSAGQGGKKLTKTLMFLEGCPRPLGCTILLKGASGDELKKVKHVVNYGVFAAYHLSLETSFLADEGASLPELPLKSPIKVALPDTPLRSGSSISIIPGSTSPFSEKPQDQQHSSNADEPSGMAPSNPESFWKKDSFSQTQSSEFAIRDMDLTVGCSPQVEGNHDSNSNIFSDSQSSGPGFGYSHGDGTKLYSILDNSESVQLEQYNTEQTGDSGALKEEFPPSTSDHQSILVSLSTRCVWKGSVCERAHIFRIKYYGSFDKPLGRFLRDHLFDQDYRCRSCELPSEAHVHCYTHRLGSLTISLRKLQEFTLPGESEGKIWMWHRCLRCPRIHGFPPTTKRVLMSNAAWGLSFGKFLELSFSNHAAASRVASCGHSLHRDCLRFYGCGRMVACFRYAPINVHSVYLPPPKLEFDYHSQEWIQREFNEVRNKADLLFSEVSKALNQIIEKNHNTKMTESGFVQQISKLESMIQMEKKEFEESLWCMPKMSAKLVQPEIDILEINKLKRQLVIHAYVWDQRLVNVSRSKEQASNLREKQSEADMVSRSKEQAANSREKRSEMDIVPRSGRGFSSWDPSLANMIPDMIMADAKHRHVDSPNKTHKGADTGTYNSSGANSSNQPEMLQSGNTVRRAQSEGQIVVMGDVPENADMPSADSSSGILSTEVDPAGGVTEAQNSALHTKESDDVENPSNWASTPFSVIYQSFNKNSTACFLKLGKISEYNPVYITYMRELINQGGACLLLPMGLDDIIVPIYDDEPTSIISYALVSPDYKNLMSKDPEKPKNSLELSSSFSLLNSINLFSLHSFDESSSETLKSLSSVDESILSSGSRSFSALDPVQFPNTTLYTRITFSDDGPPGKVSYSVTCYYAKQFEVLRKTCIANEVDFIRSISRCKKWGAQGGKSNVFFAKTLDDRFIIKQVTKTELESFLKFAPSYFKYLKESINSGCPTCLAKIFGIYQVTSKHLKGGKESRMDVLVMENLLFRRNITRIYDLKGSTRSRYNPDSSGSNKVLLDQNLIESMPTSPIFLGTKAKRLLERAIWNDTSFLASIDVMDYSLLVGVDEEKHELVVGIIDFMRQYTWDKHLENWVKASGILGGPKNVAPTVISPKQYKKRFRKAMSAYFLMVPDQWPSSPSPVHPSGSLSNLSEENWQEKVIPSH
ncbi:1-phosphatidylinositol-3-phosphate 5-kinase FAB1B-like isoform X2 [Andrographis paniculata]|uniref:1-phosphatidylinositol-3-phosphate 5-kinase FAB1B-like isoform X2 n=1 Tax=Andrographis paniculata TaxID=175694 RepID=UPI0021E8D8A7|nr:1-phosphatidylinositol-3-phosphate 5-kinase FAB1B-like isoform X2 [Andrographis paniculata]